MADFDARPQIEKTYRKVAELEAREAKRGMYGKVTAVEIPPTKYDFSYMTAEQVIGYVKGTKV